MRLGRLGVLQSFLKVSSAEIPPQVIARADQSDRLFKSSGIGAPSSTATTFCPTGPIAVRIEAFVVLLS